MSLIDKIYYFILHDKLQGHIAIRPYLHTLLFYNTFNLRTYQPKGSKLLKPTDLGNL
jgi:hypothetical protein